MFEFTKVGSIIFNILCEITVLLSRDKSTLSAENYGLRQSIEDLRKTTDSKHQEYSMIESQSQMSLNQAAELTERQNELISKLEEKVIFLSSTVPSVTHCMYVCS